MFTVPFSGVPDCAHASTSLPCGQQHDHVAPLLRWNLPVLDLVPCQSEWEDTKRPLCLHGCLSPCCEYYIQCYIQFQLLFSLFSPWSIFNVFSPSCPWCRHRQGCALQTSCRRGLFLLARKASLQSAWMSFSWVECHASGPPILPHWLL